MPVERILLNTHKWAAVVTTVRWQGYWHEPSQSSVRLAAKAIFGGCCNTISSPGATTPAVINTILGGTNNCITGNWSVIMGGNNHNLSGCYSAVLGGDSNTDCGFNYVGLTGCGVCGVMPNAFHANTFVVTGMSGSFGGPSGSLYYCPIGGLCPVFINP